MPPDNSNSFYNVGEIFFDFSGRDKEIRDLRKVNIWKVVKVRASIDQREKSYTSQFPWVCESITEGTLLGLVIWKKLIPVGDANHCQSRIRIFHVFQNLLKTVENIINTKIKSKSLTRQVKPEVLEKHLQI